MSVASTSRVTQLLYESVPNLDFGRLITSLSQSFVANNGIRPVLTWDCDDIVVLDIAEVRVVIGFCDQLSGLHPVCVTVAVEETTQAAVHGIAETTLGLFIIDYLKIHYPTEQLRSYRVDHAATPDLIDHLIDVLNGQDATAPSKSGDDRLHGLGPQVPEAVDMDRLLHKFSSELTSRAPNLITRAIASATKSGRDDGEPAPKAKSGLFWRKGKPVSPMAALAQGRRTSATPAHSGELKAVRDALYSADASSGGRSFTTTKRALMALIVGTADKGGADQTRQ